MVERNESNNPVKTENILSLTNDRGVIPYDEKGDVGNKSKDDITGYKLACVGDIVLNSMNVFIGSVGLSKYYGCVSPVYYVLHKRHEKDDIRFYNYLFQTRELQRKLHGYGNGILDIRMRIQMSKLNTVPIPIPDSAIQKKIADYLDEKCLKIDKTIMLQKKIISKISQYYFSVVSELVYNDSKNVKLIKLGKVLQKVEQGWSPSPEDTKDENGWKVLTLAAVKGGVFHADEVKPFIGKEDRCKQLELQKGDFLLTRSNTRNLVGQVCIVDNAIQNTIFSDLIYRLSFDENYIDKDYMLFVFQSAFLRQQIERDAHGSSSTMVKITHKDINSWDIPLPDKVIQRKISEKLMRLKERLTKEISVRELLIEKYTKYKYSLIYEVVTGKKEV